MGELAIWWVAIEAVGVAAFPLTFVFFHRLPDRGFAFSKVIGLLILGYALWMGSVLGLFPNQRGTVILLLVVMAAVSWMIAACERDAIGAYVRSGWRYLLFVEAMFAIVLASAVFLRSFVPDIDSGEKPFEFAFLNAVNRADSFPPPDPWLSGHSISYYYFGYVIVSTVTKLTALSTSVTFFLGLSLMAALTWTAAFGLVYNLVAASRHQAGPSLSARPMIFGLAAAALMLVVSNVEGVFELMARHGAGSHGFYDALGIYGLPDSYDCHAFPSDCSEWYPTRFYWWWWATRMGSSHDIQEFPFFSLHFGDLHAHVMAMPLVITLLAVSHQIVSGLGEPGPFWPLKHARRFSLIALLAGGIAFTDSWAIPLTVTLVVAAVMVSQWTNGDRRILETAAAGAAFAAALAVGVVLLYLPYYLHLPGDTNGIAVAKTAFTSGTVPQASEATRPVHFLLFWGPLLWVVISPLAASAWVRRREAALRTRRALAVTPWAVPLGLWAVLVVAGEGPGGLADELHERGANLLTVGVLVLAITVVALLFVSRSQRDDGAGRSDLFVLMIAGFALVMLLGAELFYVRDALRARSNTVFRFWHEAWILLAIAGAFGSYRLTANWRMPRFQIGFAPWRYLTGWGMAIGVAYTLFVAVDPWETLYSRWWTATPGLLVAGAGAFGFAAASAVQGRSARSATPRLLWLVATASVLGAALTYPVLVTFDRTGGFRYSQTLNGLDFVHRRDSAEYEAIRWLNENVGGTPVIAEAVGDDFSDAARISSRTGLPAVIGWVNHERQWRGISGPVDDGEPALIVRPLDVSRLYSSTDVPEALTIIAKYEIEYVYVGALERETYGTAGLSKFSDFMDIAFQNGGVTIYRMPPEPEPLPPG